MGSRLGMRRDPCAVCGLPVFLAEKLVISRTLYHRTCFRCARCKNQLTPGNYYETEEGQYCCETCPDEESRTAPTMHQSYNEAIFHSTLGPPTQSSKDIFQKSLSDEEKIGKGQSEMARSPPIASERISPASEKISPASERSSYTQKMRLNFIESHLLSEKLNELSVVDGPETLSRSTASSNSENSLEELSVSPESSAPSSPKEDELDAKKCDPIKSLEVDSRSFENQRLTAISSHDVDNKSLDLKENTKDLLGEAAATSPSLVQQRLKMFESQENDVRTWKGDFVKAAISKKDFKPTEKKKEQESLTLENVKPRESLESRVKSTESSESRDNFESREVTNLKESPESKEPPDLQESPDLKGLSHLKESPNLKEPSDTKKSSDLRKESDLNQSSVRKDLFRTKDSSQTRDDVADSCKSVEPLSPCNKEIASNVSRKMIDDSNSKTSGVNTESNLFTTKGIDLSDDENYPEALNPFADEDEQIEKDQTNNRKISTNPFDSDEDEVSSEIVSTPQPAERGSEANKNKDEQVPVKRRLQAPQISLNPFLSDDEEESDTEVGDRIIPTTVPVPKPRTINLLPSKADFEQSGMYASNTSLTSCGSTPGATSRKKKPAPQPPTKETLSYNSNPSSPRHNSSINPNTSPYTSRLRKAKPAPPPPLLMSSTLQSESLSPHTSFSESPIVELADESDVCKLNMWEDQKSNKDEMNRNRQNLSCVDNPSYGSYTDKSVQGKWKRKKGPAPPRPVPHRRKIKVLSMKDIKLELDEIELQQQGLEKQGVRLEQIIRDKSESMPIEDTGLGADVEELVLELFVLVNEKNELFRRQAELMLLRRQQRLEEEHADVEYQIRCLMCQPEATKTDFDKQREEALIQRLVQIVERRNEIVECLEMDRKREVEEDRSINKHMGLYAAKGKSDTTSDNDANRPSKIKKGKVKEKFKEKKMKKSHKKDADKDVDEAEVKLKRHSKRKWF